MKFLKYFFILIFLSTLLLAKAIFAGGGNYGFLALEQGIANHVPFKVEVTVYDWEARGETTYTDDYGNPVAANEEFRVMTHKETGGERCDPSVAKTNNSGKFIVTCYSDQEGRLTFHLEPVSRGDLGNSIEYDLTFYPESYYNPPTPIPSATSIPTVTLVVPTATSTLAAPTTKPTVVEAIATISSELVASPTATLTPSLSPVVNEDHDQSEPEDNFFAKWPYWFLIIFIAVVTIGTFLLIKKYKSQSAQLKTKKLEDNLDLEHSSKESVKTSDGQKTYDHPISDKS